MAEDQRPEPGEEPSLELPSLRSAFRRRRRKKAEPAPAPPVTTPPPPPPPPPPPDDEPEPAPKRRRRRQPVRLRPPGPVAALVTGALVGLLLVGLTTAALHVCSTWRGTSSCGNPGILLLLAIASLSAVGGALLLRLLGVATAGSTSLLGVALLGILVLV